MKRCANHTDMYGLRKACDKPLPDSERSLSQKDITHMQAQIKSVNAVQLNTRVVGFILLYVASIFFVLSSAASHAELTQSGGWTDKQYSIKGDWSISKEGDKTILRLSDKFKTKGGPDLKLFLSKKSIDDVTGKTATDGSLLIAKLNKSKGAQEYVLPEGIDLNDYESLLIHCEQFSVLWGGTAI